MDDIDNSDLGVETQFEVTRYKEGMVTTETIQVVTEVPFTIVANGVEIVTLLSTPTCLEELATGFLYTSGLIQSASDVVDFVCDDRKWRADMTLMRYPDKDLMTKRLYTSGCGKGIMFANVSDMVYRKPLVNDHRMDANQVVEVMRWLQSCSNLYKSTGGTHTAAVSFNGQLPAIYIDDVGRHNAVDKVIGRALMDGSDLNVAAVVSSGRISSEILHKVKKAGISIIISKGAPTHQTILLAREMNVTVVGFARGRGFVVFSVPERILF